MRIAILGAGAVGGYFGGLLARGGHAVVMLARGDHLEALRRRGIEVRTPDGTFTAPVEAVGEGDEPGAADYALVGVKNYSLPAIAPAVRRAAAAGAVVVPLLNGVEVTDRLTAAGVPRANLLGGLTTISAVRIAPGIVERRSPFQDVVVGELEGGASSDRAERIVAAIAAAGGEARVSADITADVWRKFAFISATAAACGLARSAVGPLRDHPLGPLLFERAVREAIAVGRARGVVLGEEDAAYLLHRIETLPAAMRPSYLVDLEAGGPTELDDLCGAVARLGRLAGVATPVHDTATAALGVYEAARLPRAG
jgi:2-dehydropantoate 2-reductase